MFEKMASKLMIQLQYTGISLSPPPSSRSDLLKILSQTEKILSKVRQSPSESILKALNPTIEAIFAKELVRHADMNVNIVVACCIAEIMRIMAPDNPYNDDRMKDFFEMVVSTFEKVSSAYGGCYSKMTGVLKKFSKIKLWVLMLDLELDGKRLIFRLFKQFLTVADYNSSAIVLEMEKIMTMIIDENEEVAAELLSLVVTVVKCDNRIASPVCWQLGEKVLMNYATQLKPNLPQMTQDMSIALYDYSKMVARIRDTALVNEILEAKDTISYTTHKIKLECPEETVSHLDVHSKDNSSPLRKQAQSFEHGENLVGSRIEVWWPLDEAYYQGVIKSFDFENKRHKVSYDDGDEELLCLKNERWKLLECKAS